MTTDYELLDAQLSALLDNEPDPLAAASNFVALLYNGIRDINWLGIYVLRGDELVLGPFQGKPACVHIALDEGVCGAAASTGLRPRSTMCRPFACRRRRRCFTRPC